MIGISSPLFSLQPFRDIAPIVIDHFQLWEVVAEGEHDLNIIKDHITELQDQGIEFQIHAPQSDINITSIDQHIKEYSINRIVGVVEAAHELGISTVTIHPGHLSPLGIHMKEKVLERNRVSVAAIWKRVKDLNPMVCLENMPRSWATICQVPEEWTGAVEGTGFKLCLDLGHANTRGLLSDFLKHIQMVGNIHIHDNMGRTDEHLVVGQGTIDFAMVGKALEGYTGNIIIESRGLDHGLQSLQAIDRMLPGL